MLLCFLQRLEFLLAKATQYVDGMTQTCTGHIGAQNGHGVDDGRRGQAAGNRHEDRCQ
ncbi:hypothetical protein ZBT109_1172 [Zymobacter palmae]|uniref:Uncharacterized protein n=1 Tax=Zymobacter palmae TaxID=33074 RepID=A0A348HE81_9GAMM|nr:hypothetical protein ZBT109_1172 [Zymobacter palmae]